MQSFRPESIRELRDVTGMTMEKFAETVGVSKQVISTWETGACEPRIKSLLKISEAYHKPLDFFLTERFTTVAKRSTN